MKQLVKRSLKGSPKTAVKTHPLSKIYQEVASQDATEPFLNRALDRLGIDCNIVSGSLTEIPATGKMIIVANHPFGGIEGLVLAREILKIRPDLKIMVNYVLERVTYLKELFIGVDPFGKQRSTKFNVRPLIETTRHLQNDGILLVFPAGAVSHLSLRKRTVIDTEWKPSIGRIIQSSAAPVLPIHVDGRNSDFFQLAGMFHPMLRTVMLPQELYRKRNQTLSLRIGSLIKPKQLRDCSNSADIASYLRMVTYGLAENTRTTQARHLATTQGKPNPANVISAIPTDRLLCDIEKLDENRCLLTSKQLSVYYGKAEELPNLLTEIGRLREVSFREVGEGSGRAIDLDQFDQHYRHLFIWDHKEERLVGAYRIGHTDEILKTHGKRGLYTRTLFSYSTRFIHQLGPTLEMGRSFIRQEYQKSYMPLLLLWQGIGQYVVQHPQYSHLVGPVSISGDYTQSSKDVMVSYLQQRCGNDEKLPRVKGNFSVPKLPLKGFNATEMIDLLSNIDHLSRFISNIEGNNKGVPVLIRQYLKLDGRVLAFNVDEQFSGCLDAFLIVDLMKTSPAVLKKYMGAEGVKNFYRWHNQQQPLVG